MSWRGRLHGFTLIEILVAIVIIGVVMSIAVLSLNLIGDDRAVRKEARRLMSLIEVAETEALMQGREFGVELMTGAYRFMEFDAGTGQWAEVLQDDTLKTWKLPDGMELELVLEDKRVELNTNPAELKIDRQTGRSSNNYAPQLLVYSSGEMTPFEIAIVRAQDNRSVAITGDLLGNLEFKPGEQAE